MKTFLNVLYRRILYKIPLKLLLVLIAVFGVLFACFSNAVDLPNDSWLWNQREFDNQEYLYRVENITPSNTEYVVDSEITFVCWRTSAWTCAWSRDNSTFYNFPWISLACFSNTNNIYYFRNFGGCTLSLFYFKQDEWLIPPIFDSLECQTEYNLIPISSVDQNYCTTNNLCPSCPVCPDTPVWTWGYSQLYINNILHLWAPNIIMNIPDEIDWDYAYTQWWQNMNIDVVWYNVDYEKIDSIVQFQNYKPSSEDFQKIIWLLAPYTKIIVFFVFLFIVWAWIKKPFKSKKL